jgi:hypothetical protein
MMQERQEKVFTDYVLKKKTKLEKVVSILTLIYTQQLTHSIL